MTDNRCKIWPEFVATQVRRNEDLDPSYYVRKSPRAGGDYVIDEDAAEWLASMEGDVSSRAKSRLTTWLIARRHQGVEAPRVTQQLIHQVQSLPNMEVPARCARLLRKLASYRSPIIDITPESAHYPELLAWSESVDVGELNHLISNLQSIGCVHLDGRAISVTEAGHQHIQDLDDEPRARIGF